MRAKMLRTVSAVIGVIGLALAAMMVASEGEPGALPLGLILVGVVGLIAGHVRGKPENSQRD